MIKTIKSNGVELDAAILLTELYRRTEPLGMGVLHARPPISVDEAKDILSQCDSFRFDYLHGRPLKMYSVDGHIGDHCSRVYDRDAGVGSFDEAVEATLKIMKESDSEI